jgi:hypothetical protein
MTCAKTAIFFTVLWAFLAYYQAEDAFTKGYEQGYEQGYSDGKASMVQTEQQVFMQCTKWWFGEGNPRAMQAINQYCDRRKQ